MAKRRKKTSTIKKMLVGIKDLKIVLLLLIGVMGLVALIMLTPMLQTVVKWMDDPIGTGVDSFTSGADKINAYLSGNQQTPVVKDPLGDNKRLYLVKIHTRDISNAGTDGDVSFRILGEKGNSSDLALDIFLKQITNNLWQRGKDQTFYLYSKDVGRINSIEIGVKGGPMGTEDAWQIEKVVIEQDPMDAPLKTYVFDTYQNGPIPEIEKKTIRLTPSTSPSGSNRPSWGVYLYLAMALLCLLFIGYALISIKKPSKTSKRKSSKKSSRRRKK